MSYRTSCESCERSHSDAARFCPWCGHKRSEHFSFQRERDADTSESESSTADEREPAEIDRDRLTTGTYIFRTDAGSHVAIAADENVIVRVTGEPSGIAAYRALRDELGVPAEYKP